MTRCGNRGPAAAGREIRTAQQDYQQEMVNRYGVTWNDAAQSRWPSRCDGVGDDARVETSASALESKQSQSSMGSRSWPSYFTP